METTIADRGEEHQITVTPTEPAETAAPLAPAAGPPGAPAPDPIPFQLGAAYGALARVDVAVCREYGLPPGYLHLRATFARGGYVSRAALATAQTPSPAALDCVVDQLRRTGVPAFDGPDARLSRTYFVTPSSSQAP